MADFIPTQDALFKEFAESFASGVASAPAAYALGPGDVATITQAVSQYVQALAVAASPMTRTAPTVNDKDTARNSCRNLLRMYANQFRAHMGISEQQLIAIGVRRRPNRLAKRKCPQTSPALTFQARTPGQDQLAFCDALDIGIGTKKKPHGAERLELFVAFGHERGGAGAGSSGLPPRDAIYLGSFRKSPILVSHDRWPHAKADPTYWARWAGHNDDVGPWSHPVSLCSPGVRQAADDQSRKLAA